MRVLVTGATGQVGRAIVKHFTDQGHQVTGTGDTRLGSEDAVRKLQGTPCEAVIHAAAAFHESEIALTNCLGTQQVIELAELWKARLVYISSIQVIGRPLGEVTEEHTTAPQTRYHASKLYGEFLMGLVGAASLRITSPAGSGTPRSRLLGMFVERARQGQTLKVLGNGWRCQNFVDVRDIAAATLACVERRASGLYNIAGTTLTNWQLAEICVEELQSTSCIESVGIDPEEGVEWYVSTSKAARDIGYRPKFTIRDSIQAIAEELCSKDCTLISK